MQVTHIKSSLYYVECPYCDARIDLLNDGRGEVIKCEECDQEFEIDSEKVELN